MEAFTAIQGEHQGEAFQQRHSRQPLAPSAGQRVGERVAVGESRFAERQRDARGVMLAAQRIFEHHGDKWIIFDDQYPLGHIFPVNSFEAPAAGV